MTDLFLQYIRITECITNNKYGICKTLTRPPTYIYSKGTKELLICSTVCAELALFIIKLIGKFLGFTITMMFKELLLLFKCF